MKSSVELRQERANLVHQARELLDKAEQENRALNSEEEQQYERIEQEIEQKEKDIDRVEKQEKREQDINTPEHRITDPQNPQNPQEKRVTLGQLMEDRSLLEQRGVRSVRETEEYREAYSRWLSYGNSALTAEEYRAMQADNDTGGGYLVTPQQMVQELLKEVDDQVFVRQYARVMQLNQAASLGAPYLDEDVDDWDWTAELKTGQETDIKLGKRELRPHPLAKRVKISNTLLRMAQMGPESIVRERLSYKLGVTQENAYLNGDGDGRPLGVFTASSDGISTSRDVNDDMETDSITADGLMNVKYTLKPQYWNRARWMFHRDAIKQIRKLKDGDGQYIWQQGLQGGQPDRILDLPVTMSEFAPNDFSSTNYVGILGDWRYYWIVDSLQMQMQRLVELYAETNQTGFIGRYEGDGMPVLEQAFVRVQLA